MRNTIGRKYQALDLVKIYSELNETYILNIVRKKTDENDLAWFRQYIYGLQAGMSDLAKKKMNTEKIVAWYCWFLRLLEKSERIIYKRKFPMLNDDPLKASKSKTDLNKKRERDKMLEAQRKKDSF